MYLRLRKYKGKLICKPAKGNIKTILQEIRHTIKSHPAVKTEELIRLLNPKIRGWANYHSSICAKKTYTKVDGVFQALWRWAKRRHSQKGAKWIKRKYFRSIGSRNWVFYATRKDAEGNKTHIELVEATKTPIQRHIKIRAEANPFDPTYTPYFAQRLAQRKEKATRNRKNG